MKNENPSMPGLIGSNFPRSARERRNAESEHRGGEQSARQLKSSKLAPNGTIAAFSPGTLFNYS